MPLARGCYPVIISFMEKNAIWKRANRAIRNLTHCEDCGATGTRLERHHPDYTKPEEVQILCKKCHMKAEKRDNAKATYDPSIPHKRPRRLSQMSKGLQQAIAAVGSQQTLARRLGIVPQAISQWRKVPHLRVLQIERITGIHRSVLRPDLYPTEKLK